MPLDEVKLYTAKVEAVQPAEVQAFARRLFDPGKASVVVAGDARAFQAPLAAKLPGLEVIPAAELDLQSPTLRKAR